MNENDLCIITTPEYEETVREALRDPKRSIRCPKRCPRCNGMLVHSMSGTKCNKCNWKPENDE